MSRLRLVTDDFVQELARLHKVGPIVETFVNVFKRLKYQPTMDLETYDRIAARYGINQPRGGVVYKAPCVFTKDTLYIDAYGRGCSTDAKGNPYRAELIAKGYWNRPMPFPSDIAMIYQGLKRAKAEGLKVQLGLKSEAAPWMDQKYGVLKEILRMLKHLKINFSVFTSSDLIAHDDYLALLDKKLAKVIMRMPDVDELTLREIEPGGPSLKRRGLAIEKLKSNFIKTEIYKPHTWAKVDAV